MTKKQAKNLSKRLTEKKTGAGKKAPAKEIGNLKVGQALRTRDEFLKDGVEKPEYADKPKVFYRVVYTVMVNSKGEGAVVKRTSKKGRHLKSRPKEKFREEIYIEDDKGNPIKISDKFVRSKIDDITAVDVNYINKRCGFYPDTAEKIKKFKKK